LQHRRYLVIVGSHEDVGIDARVSHKLAHGFPSERVDSYSKSVIKWSMSSWSSG
jgi:hypothetical protein